MKLPTLILIFFFILFNTSCTSQSKKVDTEKKFATIQKIEKIEIKEQTRGTNRLFTFTPTSKTVSLNGNSTVSDLSSTEWENITKEIQAIDLSKISSLEAPTTGNFSDRALSSSISITVNGEVFQSSTFDAGIPPKELANLYRVLMKDVKVKKSLPQKNFR